jgi:hypothetical protein
MDKPEYKTVEEESRYHHYTGNTIPWFIHLMWLLFWVFSIIYLIRFMLPALQVELVTPP